MKIRKQTYGDKNLVGKNIERLRKALEEIEKELYSSNIKLEQIEKNVTRKSSALKWLRFFYPEKSNQTLGCLLQ